jgi:hypothetical protein
MSNGSGRGSRVPPLFARPPGPIGSESRAPAPVVRGNTPTPIAVPTSKRYDSSESDLEIYPASGLSSIASSPIRSLSPQAAVIEVPVLVPRDSQRVQFQLYDDFTTDLGPQYPATDLILHLIKLVSADVCSFKCNAFSAYLLLSDAGAICRNINRLIQTLDDSADDIDSWDDFEKFTVAITPLEKCVACGCALQLERAQY